MRPITRDDLEPLAIGAWILGAGGGGSPYHAYLNMCRLMNDGAQVDLISTDALADEDLVAVVSNMGAPLVGQERLIDPAISAKPVRTMERYLGRRFGAVMSLEVGGGNAFQPLLVGAVLHLPVVDADCMGRAFPEAQMTSFAIGNLPMFPLTLADIRDNEVIVARAASWQWMERVSRRACVAVGSIAATCKAPRSGREVKDWGIPNSITRAIGIGQAILDARGKHRDPVDALTDHTGGERVFGGKIVDIDRRTTEGFLRGSARVAGLDEWRGHDMTLEFQNEFAMALLDGVPSIMTPEIICVLDTVTGDAIGTETLRYGQRVTVAALPCAPVLKTARGLTLVGPRAFGYDVDFRSVFETAGS